MEIISIPVQNGDMKTLLSHLEQLINIPSPTGMTGKIEDFLLHWAGDRDISCTRTHKGGIVFSFPAGSAEVGTGENDSRPLILASHIDTLGAMVKKAGADGVDIVPVGGYPAMYALGNYCTIHSTGGDFSGTILPKNPAVHVNNKLRELVLNYDNIQVRLDYLPDEDAQDADFPVQTGDFVSLDPGFSVAEGFVKSRHLDDKASAAVLLSLAEQLTKHRAERDIYLYFNVTEETGQGISAIPDSADLLVVDMGVVGEDCQGKETHVSICAKDSSGPYNYDFTAELKAAAESCKADYVVDIFPFYGSDGSAALRAGKDFRVALIGPGVSASHGWERTHIRAMENTLKLLKAYIGLD